MFSLFPARAKAREKTYTKSGATARSMIRNSRLCLYESVRAFQHHYITIFVHSNERSLSTYNNFIQVLSRVSFSIPVSSFIDPSQPILFQNGCHPVLNKVKIKMIFKIKFQQFQFLVLAITLTPGVRCE